MFKLWQLFDWVTVNCLSRILIQDVIKDLGGYCKRMSLLNWCVVNLCKLSNRIVENWKLVCNKFKGWVTFKNYVMKIFNFWLPPHWGILSCPEFCMVCLMQKQKLSRNPFSQALRNFWMIFGWKRLPFQISLQNPRQHFSFNQKTV